MSANGLATMPNGLEDSFGRTFPYLRLSVTDVCNFRCQYCLPDGFRIDRSKKFLSVKEIDNLLAAFTQLGVKKVRLTGGEPSVRNDFVEIIETINRHEGIEQIALTTNGYRLSESVEIWRDAGITNINVSLDSLNSNHFRSLTGRDRFDDVMNGIDKCLSSGFKSVKVNAVLLKDINDHELPEFFSLARNNKLSVRFIELMQTGDNHAYFDKHHMPARMVEDALKASGWQRTIKDYTAGPAVEYGHVDAAGTVGIIAPYAKSFCDGCNRLRVTATGDLRLCLFGEQGISLRPLLQHENMRDELIATIKDQMQFKRSSHFLAMGDTGITNNLASVGG